MSTDSKIFTPSQTVQTAFSDWVGVQLALVEQALLSGIAPNSPGKLEEVMRYAVLDGGKRLRPLLLLATKQAFSSLYLSPRAHEALALAVDDLALSAACAVELIHAYSLVHDDLPCMDNDVLRRGKPTVHVRYGQAQALLAGDALQALAFELLVQQKDPRLSTKIGPCGPAHGDLAPCDSADMDEESALDFERELALLQVRLCRLLGAAAGAFGMAGGQAIDLAQVGKTLSIEDLRTMHQLKTGALLHASVMMGAELALVDGEVRSVLSEFGRAVGLLFQVVDDILDVTGDALTLGKTPGKDALAGKPTYVSVLGLAASQALATDIEQEAFHLIHRIAQLEPKADVANLKGLLTWVAGRSH